jgi:hypothetical protein
MLICSHVTVKCHGQLQALTTANPNYAGYSHVQTRPNIVYNVLIMDRPWHATV